MSLLDDIKAKADLNGDGKLSAEDLEALRSEENSATIDKLKEAADQNDDGKINLDDVKDFNIGETITDLKDKFFG